MSLQNEAVTLQRNAPTPNGANGQVENWQTVKAGLLATINQYSAYKQANAVAGAGVLSREGCVVIFHEEDYPGGFPVVRKQDRVVSASQTFRVLFVRLYETTLQLDVEIVE